jgi:3'-phosphoadenosine 5'-phosphosulfate (PAPS) 3'-phosphatase
MAFCDMMTLLSKRSQSVSPCLSLHSHTPFPVLCRCMQGSAAVLGVVHVPVTGKTYYAVAGKGAYVRDAQGNTKQIHAKEFNISDPGLVLVGSTSHANPTNNTGVHACRCASSVWVYTM